MQGFDFPLSRLSVDLLCKDPRHHNPHPDLDSHITTLAVRESDGRPLLDLGGKHGLMAASRPVDVKESSRHRRPHGLTIENDIRPNRSAEYRIQAIKIDAARPGFERHKSRRSFVEGRSGG